MTNGKTNAKNRNLMKWILDLGIFIGFLIAMEPRATGIAIHEWLSLAGLATILVHLLLNWKWIVQVTRRFLGSTSGRSRINYVLNWLLFLDGTLLMLSGFLISEAAIPALGISLPAGFAWRELHDLSANLSLLLLGLHTALHWNWIVCAFKTHIARPILGTFTKRARQTTEEGVA